MLFILALQSHTCRPYLIISAAASLPSWESEFARLSPTVNIVVYNGTKDVRRMIQTVEFYDEGGCIMFQVLISHSDAVVEDLEALYCIGWEAIIVDECQKSRVSKHFEQFRNLSSDFRLLLFSGPLKDNLVDYLNTLSFLDPKGQENPVDNSKFDITNDNDRLAILKERLAFYVAYERKPNSSKFQEYWIPAQLSNVQLGQYCNILMSNSDALHLISKVDHVGAISGILNSARKCCDHPYLIDNSLASSLTKDLSLVKKSKFEVNASGKLRLLDKILQDIKTCGLRVLILFQSIDASGKISTGDILDDFLHQRFGADSYEHFINGMTKAKKEAALERFNDKESGRFVFLIGNSACTSSIRLSSVDTVIIYGSDWKPLNDIRVLHKISIGTHLKQVKVFRLYCSWTVEEKVLIFAKQDMVIENDTQNMSPSIGHSLLSWGASYLFDKLYRLSQHNNQSHDCSSSTEKLLLNEVTRLLMQSPNMTTITDTSNCSIVVKAQLSGMRYSQNILLFGERENTLSLDNDPHTFWSKLLNRSCLQSKCISEPPQGTQKKVRQVDELATEPEGSGDELRKKRKIIVNSTINSVTSVPLQMLTETGEAVNGKAAKVSENTPPSVSDHPFLIYTSQEPLGPNISTNETGIALGVPISQEKLGSMCQSCSGSIISLTKDLSLVKKSKFEVNASGKLRLLDKILQDIKTCGLRVLILFQSIDASGKISTGDILDDFLHQRFGADSYEHFINGMTKAKKEAALERFNDKESGRFVFLIGNSACTSSIRLSSVDTVIIYGSDWKPLNDIRVLHKISIGTHLKQVKVFRLYCSWTVEEKVLIFAKQDMVIENDTQNMSPSIGHSLLSWGASYLFDKLYRLSQHNNQSHDCSSSTEKLLLNEVTRLLMQSPNMTTITDTSNCSIVVKAQLSGMRYSQNILLFGERENTLSLDNDPHTFWSKLLNRSCLQSKCISEPPQGTQKKVRQVDELATEPEGSGDELRKKRKIIVNSTINSVTSVPLQMLTETGEAVNGKAAKVSENTPPSVSDHPFLIYTSQEPLGPNISTNETGVPISQEKLGSMCQSCSGSIMNDALQGLHMPAMSLSSDVDELKMPKLGEKEAQKDLFSSINPKLLKLCETLRLPCWIAASCQKHKINHKESLALAKRYLNFECKEQQVELVYTKLKFLKEKFSHPSGVSENTTQPNALMMETFFPKHDIHKGIIHDEISGRSSSDHHVMEKCETRVCESSVPENNTAKDFMQEVNLKKTLSYDEVLEEGEIREGLSSMPSEYAAIHIMHDDSSEIASYDDEKMKGEMRKDLTSMQAQSVFRHLVHEDSSKIVPFDHEGIGEANIRMGQLSVPVNDDIKDNMNKTGPKLTSLDGKLEKDGISKSPVGHAPSEQQNLVDRLGQSSVPGNDDRKDCLHKTSPKLTLLDDELEQGEIGKSPVAHMPSEQLNLVEQEQNSILETSLVQTHQQIKSLKDEALKKQIDLIDRICSRRLDELLLRQNIDLQEFKILREKEKMELIKIHNLELDQIHGVHTGPVVREHKIKLLEQDFAKRMNEFNQHMKCQHRKFVLMQIKARNKEKQIRDCWLEEAKAGVLETCFDKLPLSVTGFKLEKFKFERYRYEGLVDNKTAASSSDLIRGPGEHFEPSNRPDSMSNCTNIVESHEPSRPSSNISPIIQYVSADNMPLKTVNPASHSNEMNAICDEFDGGIQQVDLSIHNLTVPDLLGLPPSVGLPGVPAPLGSDQELCNHVYCSAELTEFLAQQSVLGTAAQPGQSNHKFSQPLPPSVGLTSVVRGHTNTPATMGSDQKPCNQIRCSAQLTERSMQQPVVAAAAQLGQSRKLFSQPFVHLSPPATDIPSTRTPFPSNTDVQLEAVNNSPLNFTMPPSVPQQEPHPNPLHDELMRLRRFKDSFSRWHEEMVIT
ncbi:hypothetical protein COCNU_scaffold008759G000060 [Cocos nucifera]|nr:hypothetical protein [Cocos nucifera]